MAAKKKKKKKDKRPSPPSQHFDVGQLKEGPSQEEFFDSFNKLLDRYPEIAGEMIEMQLRYAPQMTEAQRQNQTVLFQNMANLKRAEAPNIAAAEQQILDTYAPQFRQDYAKQQQRLDVYQADIDRLRGEAHKELGFGYELGDELGREVEQGIRAAQTARGNYLGPAATAQEAMGKGAAARQLYESRVSQFGQTLNAEQAFMGARQNYLQGANPISMMGQAGAATGLMEGGFFPGNQVDVGLGGQGFAGAVSGASNLFSSQSASASNFNSALINAFGQNAESAFNTYDRQYEQYLEKLAIKQGLFSQPSVGGGGGGGMQMAGAAIGAVGAIGGGLLAF